MIPHWVADLEDYMRWVRTLIDESGAVLVMPPPGEPHFELLPLVERRGQEEPGFAVQDHTLKFYDGSQLDFRFALRDTIDGWENVRYTYHFQSGDGVKCWRHDKHRGHEDEFGNQAHFHPRGDDDNEPSGEVDLGDVLALAWTTMTDAAK